MPRRNLRGAGLNLVELVNWLNCDIDPIEEAEVEKWPRGNKKENLDIEFIEDKEILTNVNGNTKNSDGDDEENPSQKV